MLDNEKFANLFQQFDTIRAQHPTSAYALRDVNSRYLTASSEYLQLFFCDQSAPLPVSVAHSSLDLATKHSLLFKDQQALRQQEPLYTLEPVISGGQLMVVEVYRYPLLEQEQVVALGVLAQYPTDSSLANFSERNQLTAPPLNTSVHSLLSQRDWLIGLLLLQNWTAVAIASHLKISYGRLGQILARICRRKFGVSGAAGSYRRLLIETGLYKQIPLELLTQYALPRNESLQ
jgi:hypothetical protein